MLAFAMPVLLVAVPARVSAQGVLLKDIANVQGVTANQLIGYGIVTGLNQTGDSTSVLFTSKTIQNILQTFGLSTASTDVRTRDVAAVMVTAKLPPFAHSGDSADVLVSALGDSTTLQGGTLMLTELRGANNLVYATAQGPVSVGGFSADTGTGNSIAKNFVTAGRVPGGAVIARDMITNLQQDPAGLSYVLSTPDYRTAAHAVAALNHRFGGGTAHALDAATVRVRLPARYVNDPVTFLADAGDLKIDADQLAKVVINERTGTIVMGGDSSLATIQEQGYSEADIYRELCSVVAIAGRTPGGRRRIDLMIAAIAIGDGAALATRNTSDFEGLQPLLHVITL